VKIKSLRYDKDVKPFWKRLMNTLWLLIMLLIVSNFFMKLYAKNHSVNEDFQDVFLWIYLIAILLFLIPGVVYWVSPSLFKLNKEQSVQVSDTTKAK